MTYSDLLKELQYALTDVISDYSLTHPTDSLHDPADIISLAHAARDYLLRHFDIAPKAPTPEETSSEAPAH